VVVRLFWDWCANTSLSTPTSGYADMLRKLYQLQVVGKETNL